MRRAPARPWSHAQGAAAHGRQNRRSARASNRVASYDWQRHARCCNLLLVHRVDHDEVLGHSNRFDRIFITSIRWMIPGYCAVDRSVIRYHACACAGGAVCSQANTVYFMAREIAVVSQDGEARPL